MGSEAQHLDGHPGDIALGDMPEGSESAAFGLLADSLSQPVWVCGPNGGLRYMNPSGLAYFGGRRCEAAHLFPSSSLTHVEDHDGVRNAWERAWRDEREFELRVRLRRQDGVFRWHSVRAQPLRDAAGQVHGWIGSASTALESAERSDTSAFLLQLSTDCARIDNPHELLCTVMLRLRERLNVSQVALAEVDEGRNEAIVLRQDPEDPSGLQVESLALDLLGESRLDSRNGEMVVVSNAVTEHAAAAWYARCCGLPLLGSVVSAPLHRAGELVALLIAGESSARTWSPSEVELTRRVAEIVWPALEKTRADRALATSEQRLRLAQVVAQIGAWELDAQTHSMTFSPESLELLGLKEGEPDLHGVWMSRIDARDREALGELVRECESAGSAEVEYRYAHPQRGERWIYCRAGRAGDIEGIQPRIVGVSLDVTERRRAEEALKDVNQRKDQFLAMLGHELRNPLAPIRNAIEILNAHRGATPQLQWARDIIERQTRHLTRLVDDLLDVARTVRGQITLQTAPLELSELIQHAVETTGPLIRERRHRLQVNLPSEPVQIVGDLTRLAQAVANLLNNAAKYTPAGGEIWLEASFGGAEVEVRVSDSGPGLAPELVPHVFDLFTQAERPLDRSQGGLGIGLTLVKMLVDMHGGSVEALNSVRHPGAEFILRIPAEKRPAASQPAHAAAASDSHMTLESERSMRVLIVDDNVDAAESIALLLGLDGFEARSVYSASATLDVISSFKPDVVLLDIGLPVMDGYELARRLRTQFPGNGMRIVGLSGYGQPADRERAAKAGFDDYLVKPVEPNRLSTFLRSLEPKA